MPYPLPSSVADATARGRSEKDKRRGMRSSGRALRHHGGTAFAAANIKDFAGFGFTCVWNPLAVR